MLVVLVNTVVDIVAASTVAAFNAAISAFDKFTAATPVSPLVMFVVFNFVVKAELFIARYVARFPAAMLIEF